MIYNLYYQSNNHTLIKFNYFPLEFKIKTLRHLLVLLWASQANTRPSSFWIIHHLIRHPDAIEAILREYEDIRAGKSDQINVDHHSSEATHEMDDILNLEKADLDSMVILGKSNKVKNLGY